MDVVNQVVRGSIFVKFFLNLLKQLFKSLVLCQSEVKQMAREWSLQETKALVEEHIALKEEEIFESQTASEHWNKISKKLREKGFYQSYKSCNKRWYRLEQYEVQIFSFNTEEGKSKNYWDLTRVERLEYRNKWPQLPLGDGIDKDMFDLLKNFSHQFEKKDKLESTNTSTICVDNNEAIYAKPNIKITRQSILPPPLTIASPHLTPRILSHTTIVNSEEKSELQVGSQSSWPPMSEQPPLSSQGALDGFKLQARELRKRRATEFRKNNRSVPYNSTHTTFMKGTQPSILVPSQISPLTSETTTFGSITMIPPLENTMLGENLKKNLPKDNVTQTKPPIQFKKLFNSSSKMDTNQTFENKNNNNSLPTHQQPIGSHLNFQSQNSRPIGIQQRHVLHSINSHLPLLQPKDNYFTNNKNGANLDAHPMDSNNLLQKSSELGSLEKHLQVIMDLQTTQICEQQLHKNTNKPDYGQIIGNPLESQGSTTSSLLGIAIGGLGMQLEAIAKLLQVKQAAEQEFQEKILYLVECMVVSMRSMAQASIPTST